MTDSSKPSGGWCGRGFKPRVFPERDVIICYDKCPAALVDRAEYDRKRHEALLGSTVMTLTVPKKSARTWKMLKGDLCRITVIEGPQVGDLNFWNLNNKKERFYSGKTRQLHSAHLNVYDRLWSNFPFLRPMATFVADSIKYGIDQDGAGLHDVIGSERLVRAGGDGMLRAPQYLRVSGANDLVFRCGRNTSVGVGVCGTRCDDYTYKLIRGKERIGSCHSALTAAAIDAGLTEDDVHDVWNIFMCTGFTKDTHQYFCKGSPTQKGDYIEFIADMDLLVGLSACPQGDVSIPVGKEVPDSKCFPLQVEVFRAK